MPNDPDTGTTAATPGGTTGGGVGGGQSLPGASAGAAVPTAEELEAGATREELYDQAGDLDVQGRSQMSKAQLAQAIAEAKAAEARRAPAIREAQPGEGGTSFDYGQQPENPDTVKFDPDNPGGQSFLYGPELREQQENQK